MPTRIIECPACGLTMQKRKVDGVEIDFCDHHGVWLDVGELERLHMTYYGNSQPEHHPSTGKAFVQGLAGAAVMGAGFSIGQLLVGGIVDAIFHRRI